MRKGMISVLIAATSPDVVVVGVNTAHFSRTAHSSPIPVGGRPRSARALSVSSWMSSVFALV
jgi:hypothetical protein